MADNNIQNEDDIEEGNEGNIYNTTLPELVDEESMIDFINSLEDWD